MGKWLVRSNPTTCQIRHNLGFLSFLRGRDGVIWCRRFEWIFLIRLVFSSSALLSGLLLSNDTKVNKRSFIGLPALENKAGVTLVTIIEDRKPSLTLEKYKERERFVSHFYKGTL